MRGTICKLLAPVLLLSACSTPQPGIKTVLVDRPVIQVQHCVKQEDVPVRPERLGPAPPNLEQALSLALAKISEWTRYGNKADEILKACTE